MVLEAMLIAYLYAILLVLDTILGFAFLKSCKPDYQIDHIEIQERNDKSLRKIKGKMCIGIGLPESSNGTTERKTIITSLFILSLSSSIVPQLGIAKKKL
ncbi:hypothetical protein Sango_1747400 [Sesamum angolense]|uniref:Uncharacterized protein n=1 Tax=Sesamum angolense TaxID=2727404 RepID=A0AAE2BSA0_9LAMI|nr:hypothetical protein Sango_1747400 [Sesamum angolense]